MNLFTCATVILCVSSALSADSGSNSSNIIAETPKLQPKNRDYQEANNKNTGYPESKVTITVGDKTGFHYTVNGITNSDKKIAVSGEYYDNSDSYNGYARLFLVVDTGIAYYALRPHGNILDVYVENYMYDEFYFEIICPKGVSSYNLHEGQINGTAVLITGPSRSSIYYPRLKNVRNSMSKSERSAMKANGPKSAILTNDPLPNTSD